MTLPSTPSIDSSGSAFSAPQTISFNPEFVKTTAPTINRSNNKIDGKKRAKQRQWRLKRRFFSSTLDCYVLRSC